MVLHVVGAMLSPLLSNLYLHPLDRVMSQTAYKAIRSCDDLMVRCRTQAEAEAALDLIRGWTAAHGLRLHAEKTRIVDASKGGSGVTFLGYWFASGQRYVRRQGLKALRDPIRHKTGRTRGGSLEEIIAVLNPMLRGWFGYFKQHGSRSFGRLIALSGIVCERSCASGRSAPVSG